MLFFYKLPAKKKSGKPVGPRKQYQFTSIKLLGFPDFFSFTSCLQKGNLKQRVQNVCAHDWMQGSEYLGDAAVLYLF